jgi:hypothetical protein
MTAGETGGVLPINIIGRISLYRLQLRDRLKTWGCCDQTNGIPRCLLKSISSVAKVIIHHVDKGKQDQIDRPARDHNEESL